MRMTRTKRGHRRPGRCGRVEPMSGRDASSERDAYHHGDLRRALLAHARAVVAEKGAEALSIRAATKAVGVDPAAAYRHFRRKNDILAAVAAEGFIEQASPGAEWGEAEIAAMARFMGHENYDNRIRSDALIDREVLADIRAKRIY